MNPTHSYRYEAKKKCDRLFVAIMPPRSVAARIREAASLINRCHLVAGNLRPVSHLHLTIFPLGDYPNLENGTVRRAMNGCKAAAAASQSLELEFDRMTCWNVRDGKVPLVLTTDRRIPALDSLYQKTVIQLNGEGFAKPAQRFTPHVTTSYNRRSFGIEAIPSVRWWAEELVLIHSFVGLTKYVELGRWKLGEIQPTNFSDQSNREIPPALAGENKKRDWTMAQSLFD